MSSCEQMGVVFLGIFYVLCVVIYVHHMYTLPTTTKFCVCMHLCTCHMCVALASHASHTCSQQQPPLPLYFHTPTYTHHLTPLSTHPLTHTHTKHSLLLDMLGIAASPPWAPPPPPRVTCNPQPSLCKVHVHSHVWVDTPLPCALWWCWIVQCRLLLRWVVDWRCCWCCVVGVVLSVLYGFMHTSSSSSLLFISISHPMQYTSSHTTNHAKHHHQSPSSPPLHRCMCLYTQVMTPLVVSTYSYATSPNHHGLQAPPSPQHSSLCPFVPRNQLHPPQPWCAQPPAPRRSLLRWGGPLWRQRCPSQFPLHVNLAGVWRGGL